MKNLWYLILLFFCVAQSSYGQFDTKNAMGLRLGDNNGFIGELSYQRFLSEKHIGRLEFGLGWKDSKNFESIKLLGLYELVSKLAGNYDWYIGAGGGFGHFEQNNINDNLLIMAGVIGIEYSEDNLPLQFSLDLRPEYSFNDNYSDDIDFDIGIAIRYQF